MNKWDKYFLKVCYNTLQLSKDPSVRVGAALVGPDHKRLLSTGYNGLPSKVSDLSSRLTNRDLKLHLTVHAEVNALLTAAKHGVNVEGSSLYLIAETVSGDIWGGPPCIRCMVHLVQSGITEVNTILTNNIPQRWKESTDLSRTIMKEAGVTYNEIEAGITYNEIDERLDLS